MMIKSKSFIGHYADSDVESMNAESIRLLCNQRKKINRLQSALDTESGKALAKLNRIRDQRTSAEKKCNELEGTVSSLRDVIATGWQMLAFAENMPNDAERIAMEVFKYLSDENEKLRSK